MNESLPPPAVPPALAPTPPPSEKDIRTWNMWCHLSALSGLVVPLGNLLGPLLVWQIKKNEFPSVEAHGKAALNWQLTVFIASLVGVGLAIVLAFICIGFLFIPVLLALGIANIVFTVIAGIKANDGKEYRYPVSFKFL